MKNSLLIRILSFLAAILLVLPLLSVSLHAEEMPEEIGDAEFVEPIPFVPDQELLQDAPEESVEIRRLFGSNRIETSISIADELLNLRGTDHFDVIVLASASSFPDALSGSFLAAKQKAPILLYRPSSASRIISYISEHLSRDGLVYILGGTGVIDTEAEVLLEEMGITTARLAGENRYETNMAIINESLSEETQTLILAAGFNFADGLSASGAALPVFLLNKKLTEEQRVWLKEHPFEKYVILGGESAVSLDLQQELVQTVADGDRSRIVRLSGLNRHDTSRMVASYFYPSADKIVLAESGLFPDGLCGGPLAAELGCPLILTSSGKTEQAEWYAAAQDLTSCYVLGGDGLISDENAAAITGVRSMADRSGFNTFPLEAMGYVPEEVVIDLPEVEEGEEKHYLFFSDMHIGVDDEMVSDHKTVLNRIKNFASWTGNTSADKWANISSVVDACHADGVLLGGDMIDFASVSNITQLQEGLDRFSAPYMYIRADHDLKPWWCSSSDVSLTDDLQETIDGHPSVNVIELEDYFLVGIDNNTSPVTEETLEEFRSVLELGKPVVLMLHVPLASEVDDGLAEVSAEQLGRVLLWGEDAYYKPDSVTEEFLELIYSPDSPVKEVLAGHLHFSWDGALTDQTNEHVFASAASRGFGVVTIR